MSDAIPSVPTMWQRLKSGVKGFFSHAIGYLPRGLAFTGLIFAGSAALEAAFQGTSFLGIASSNNAQLLAKAGAHLAFGSLISGVLGAGSEAVCCKCPDASSACAQQIGQTKSANSTSQQIAKSLTETCMTAATEHAFTGHGLGAAAVKTAAKTMGVM